MDRERIEAAVINSGGKKGSKRQVRLRGRGSAEHGKVASGSATQRFWLGDRKVGSQVIGENRSRLPVRGTAGEVTRKRR